MHYSDDDPSPIVTSVAADTPVTLEWLRLGARKRVPDSIAANLDATAERDRLRDEMVYTLTTQVLGQRVHTPPVTVMRSFKWQIPASPWQAWKQAHARTWWAGWLARVRPVRTHTEVRVGELTVNAHRAWTWPDAPEVPDSWGTPVQVVVPRHLVRWHGEQ